MARDPISEDDAPSKAGASPYADYLAERTEILAHKWNLSEKEGRDVGFETALMDWAQHHRTAWRKARAR